MKLLLEFSGEHSRIPEAELDAVLEGEGFDHSVLERFDSKRIVLLDVDAGDTRFLDRLAFTRDVSEIVSVARTLEEAADAVVERIGGAGSFRVMSESKSIENSLGDLIRLRGVKVNLRKPDVRVSCSRIKDRYYAGIHVERDRSFSFRKPQHRPFFHPTSMHPKLARALVNIARVKPGDAVLDPFCGTGGILIEAGLMGMKPVGVDIDVRMTEGCMRNLEHYGLSGRIRQGDALELKGVDADAIVTDPPYGRASYSTDRMLESLYRGMAKKALELLDPGRRMVITMPDSLDLSEVGLNTVDVFNVRVHRSLTRSINVLEVC
ncbi:MAG: DNA methyltransferase [Candidatus Altiarchaeota archaeon]